VRFPPPPPPMESRVADGDRRLGERPGEQAEAKGGEQGARRVERAHLGALAPLRHKRPKPDSARLRRAAG